MAEKEERIYIRGYGKDNPCDTCEDTSGEECDFCMENYEWNASIPRKEAINRMAKAICKETNYQCSVCEVENNKEKCEEWILFQYKPQAEAALNALLEKE